MEIRKLAIYSATQKKTPEETSLYKSIKNLNIEVDLNFWVDNKTPLAELYNSALLGAKLEENDALIFVHDDVWLEHDPTSHLERLFDSFDVVGVAGCSNAEIKSPALWHIMGQGHLHGAVAHKSGDHKVMTSFGVYPHRVVMIDGVFMALNRKAIESGVLFDEDCPSNFHFYDLDASLKMIELGLKIGVGDIMITHESSGLREFTDEWREGESFFLKKHIKI